MFEIFLTVKKIFKEIFQKVIFNVKFLTYFKDLNIFKIILTGKIELVCYKSHCLIEL